VVTSEQAREIALRLPEAEEAPHHEATSFRVRGKIFATAPDEASLNVMIAAEDVPLAVAMNERAVRELWWGKRLSGVTVDLRRASVPIVHDLLEQAWRRRAPKMLVHEVDGRRGNDELEPVLEVLRTWPELTAKGRAVFHAKGRAFLHFHQSKVARHADVREGTDWGAPIELPVGALSKRVQREFLDEVRRRLDVTLARR
jgi:hypothetical protein